VIFQALLEDKVVLLYDLKGPGLRQSEIFYAAELAVIGYDSDAGYDF